MQAPRIDFTVASGERPGRSLDALYLLLALGLHVALAWSAARPRPEAETVERPAFFVELEPTRTEPPVTTPPPPAETKPTHAPESPQPLARAWPAVPAPGAAAAEASPETAGPPELSPEDDGAAEPAPLLTDPLVGSDFEMASGSGRALGGNGNGNGAGLAQRTGYLAPRDFSRAPVPPDLKPLVRRNYPSAAKMYGYEGTVRVSLVVRSDGSVSDVRVEDADPSGRGFGEACTRTMLQGGAWKPRLDRNGRPVDSPSEFTCAFRL